MDWLIGKRALDFYARLFARRALFRFHKGLFHVSARGLGLSNLADMSLSGELWILRHLARRGGPTMIFDVGANEGDFLRCARSSSSDAVIHAFEPHPQTFARLARSTEGLDRIHLNASALSDGEGRAELFDVEGEDGTALASLHRGAVAVAGRRVRPVTVEMCTLDSYAARHGVDRIDLLKIDTEGHELAVLRGARNLIAENRILRVQFEFNEMNVASRSFIADFRRELPAYRFYRLLVDGPVSLDPYAPFYSELFAYQNILAVHPDVGL